MNKEISEYVITYFMHLASLKEKAALKYYHSLIKLDNSETFGENEKRRRVYEKLGWLSSDKEIVGLLKDGYEAFELNISKRLLSTHPDEIFLNYCPECNRLARTPMAKQCRYCGYNWREKTVASFQIKEIYYLQSREGHILLGELLNGQLNPGYYVDLTMIGLNVRPPILYVESLLKKQYNTNTALGIKLDDKQVGIIEKSKMSIVDILKK